MHTWYSNGFSNKNMYIAQGIVDIHTELRIYIKFIC